jgi:shikimate dehydrogenase
MPGAGKSRIGAELAKLTGKKFVDTDALIVQTAGKTIPDIFAEDGEDKFRDYETEALYQAENNRGAIIATGGGIIKRQKNLHALSSNGKVVWIQRDIGDLTTSGRPLSKDTDALKKLYQERSPLYQSASDFTVKNVGNPTDVAKEILSLCEF